MGDIAYTSNIISNLKPIEERLPVVKPIHIPYYEGKDVELELNGEKIFISAEMDAFNFYRKVFRKIAKQASTAFKHQYRYEIRNLDQFLIDFSPLYFSYRRPIIEAAIDILTQAEIYDISLSAFDESHTAEFCLCGEDYKTVIDNFNATLQNNQINTAKGFDMLPNIFFSGVGGIIVGTALNVTINGIAESSIKNAKVSTAQRKKLFEQINTDALMERAFLDYWRVFLTLRNILRQHNKMIWCPSNEEVAKAEGIYMNLKERRIPEEKRLKALVDVLETNPFSDDYLDYIKTTYPQTKEIEIILKYFGYEM
ncbi:MAG: hypothetical protein J6A73_00435 [Lachnospiraceae bacterium]|nr:hypothetical protein [Lachnospiraceae bacterium]